MGGGGGGGGNIFYLFVSFYIWRLLDGGDLLISEQMSFVCVPKFCTGVLACALYSAAASSTRCFGLTNSTWNIIVDVVRCIRLLRLSTIYNKVLVHKKHLEH